MSNFNFIGNFLGKSAQLSKDGHDVSNSEAVSLPFGMHAPIARIPVVPNEHYKGTFSSYVQTAPMREDNFAQLYDNLTAVFVPLSSICRDYMSLVQGSSRSTRQDPAIPVGAYYTFAFRNFLDYLFPLYALYMGFQKVYMEYPQIYDSYLIKSSGNIYEDIAYGGDINNRIKFADFKFKGFLTTLRLCGYHGDANTDPDNNYLFGYLFDAMSDFNTQSGENFVFDVLRILDNLGYGNWLPLFDMVYTKYYYDAFTSSLTVSKLFDATLDEPGTAIVATLSTRKLSSIVNGGTILNKMDSVASLFPLMAYQFYINMYERSNYRMPSTRVITADALTAKMSSLSSIFVQTGGSPITYNLADVPQVYNSYDFSDAMSDINNFQISGSFSDLNSSLAFWIYFFQLSNPLLEQDIFTTMQQTVVCGTVPTTTSTALTNNLIQTIADTSALYKYKQDLLRAGVRRDKQIAAVFGVEGTNNLYESVIILDRSKSQLTIQGLINQADSEYSPLGTRASKGNGSGYLDFEFHSKDFGYIFIVQSFTCENYYEAFMMDRDLELSPEGWFVPERAHLGLEAVYTHQISQIGLPNSGVPFIDETDITTGTTVHGFSARDWNLKQRVNKLHGAFTSYGMGEESDRKVSVYRRDYPAFVRGNAVYGGYLPSLISQQINCFKNIKDMYYNPEMVNNLFVDMFHGALACDYAFDHFRLVYNLQLHKVSPMPKLGLIKLNV